VIRKKNSHESQEISILGIKGKSEPGGKRFLFKENFQIKTYEEGRRSYMEGEEQELVQNELEN